MKSAVLKSDIPNESWLAEKMEDVISSGKNQHGLLKYFGPITGTFNRILNLPVSELSLLKGERGEQSNVRPESLEYIKDNYSEVSKNPVYVEVDPLGVPWVSEGNHRIMASADLGVQSLQVEVRYFSGSERIDGPFSPGKLLAHDSLFLSNQLADAERIKIGGTKATQEANTGSFSGKILDVSDGFVIQKINRQGDTVKHKEDKLSSPVKIFDVVDINYLNGVGMVSGLDKDLGVGR